MRRAGGDDDRRLRARDAPDAVLGRRRAQAMALDGRRDDRLDLLGRHLGVGLVVEMVDVAGDAAEGHDRAGARIAHGGGQRVERERLGAHGDVRGGRRAARTGGISASSSPACSAWSSRRVLAVDGEHERQAAGEVVDGGERIGDPRALGQLELEPIAPGPLAQRREEADVDDHVRQGSQIGDA